MPNLASKILCIFVTGGAYAPYAPCLSSMPLLDVAGLCLRTDRRFLLFCCGDRHAERATDKYQHRHLHACPRAILCQTQHLRSVSRRRLDDVLSSRKWPSTRLNSALEPLWACTETEPWRTLTTEHTNLFTSESVTTTQTIIYRLRSHLFSQYWSHNDSVCDVITNNAVYKSIDWLIEYNFLSHNAVILLSCTDECVTDSDCGSHGKCLNITDFSYPQKQCFCQPGYFGFKCEKGNNVVKVCRELKMIGKGFVLFKINSSPSAFYIIKPTCVSWLVLKSTNF